MIDGRDGTRLNNTIRRTIKYLRNLPLSVAGDPIARMILAGRRGKMTIEHSYLLRNCIISQNCERISQIYDVLKDEIHLHA